MDSEKNIFEKAVSGVSSAVSDAIPRPDKIIRYGILGQPLSEKDRKKQEDLLRVAEENKENTFYGIPIPSKIKESIEFDVETGLGQYFDERKNKRSLVNFTAPQWDGLMKQVAKDEITFSDVVRGVVNEANKNNTNDPIVYDELLRGTAPILKVLPSTKDFKTDTERRIGDTEIIQLLTNVRDYGLSEGDSRLKAKVKGFGAGVLESIPEAYGMAQGTKIVLPRAIKAAKSTKNPAVALGKFITYLGVGGLLGSITAGKLEDELIGAADPVVYDLSGYKSAGEVATLGAGLVGGLLKKGAKKTLQKATDIPDEPTIGMIQFLNNYRNVAENVVGKNAGKVGTEALDDVIKNSGLSQKTIEKIYKAVDNSGKRSKLFNPVKGPVALRAVGGFEKQARATRDLILTNPKKFMADEGFLAAGAGVGAIAAQKYFPYNDIAQVASEIVGGGVAGVLPNTFIFGKTVNLVQGALGANVSERNLLKMGKEVGEDVLQKQEQLVSGAMQRKAASRIQKAALSDPAFDPVYDEGGNLLVTRMEQFGRFIDQTIKGSAEIRKQKGEDAKFTLMDIEYKNPDGTPNKEWNQFSNRLGRQFSELEAKINTNKDELELQRQADVRGFLLDLVESGDPDAIKAAAILYEDIIEESQVIKNTDFLNKILEAQKKVMGRDFYQGENRKDVNKKLQEGLKTLFDDYKKTERQLWNEVDDSFPLIGTGTTNQPEWKIIGEGVNAEARASAILSGESDPVPVPNLVKIFRDSGKEGGAGNSIGQNKTLKSTMDGYADFEEIEKFFGFTPNDVETLKQIKALEIIRSKANKVDVEDIDRQLQPLLEKQARIYERVDTNLKIRKTMQNIAENPQFVPTKSERKLIESYPLTARRVRAMRSDLRAAKNKAKTAGNTNISRLLTNLDNAVRNDLMSEPETLNGAYQRARAFTAGGRKAFEEQDFVEYLTGYNKEGVLKYDPDGIADNFFNLSPRGGASITQKNIDSVKEALSWLVDAKKISKEDYDKLDPSEAINLAFRDRFQEFFKEAAELKNKVTGVDETKIILEQKYRKWRNSPGVKQLIESVPELEGDLNTLEDAIKVYDTFLNDPFNRLDKKFNTPTDKLFFVKADPEVQEQALMRQAARTIFGSSPVKMVNEAMSSANPVKSLNAMVRLINEAPYTGRKFITDNNKKLLKMYEDLLESDLYSGDLAWSDPDIYNERILLENAVEKIKGEIPYTKEQAQQGFLNAVMNYAFIKTKDGKDIKKLVETLTGQMPNVNRSEKGAFSLLDFLEQRDVITKEHRNNIEKTLKEALEVEQAADDGTLSELLFSDKSKSSLSVPLIRIVGATAGNVVQKRVKDILKTIGLDAGGGGLIAESEGSKVFVNHFITAPAVALNKQMAALYSDPELLASVLRQDKLDKKLKSKLQRLVKFFGGDQRQGYMYLDPILREVERQASDEIQNVSDPLITIRKTPQPNTTSSDNSPRVSNIRPDPVRQVATGPVTSPTTNPTAVGIQGSITPESAQRFAQVFGANDSVLTMGIGGLVR